MRREITVNGIPFEVKSNKNFAMNLYPMKPTNPLQIYECYNRPSPAKQSVWKYWLNWAREASADIRIESYNTFGFTITGTFIKNNRHYGVRITKTHNYIYEL